MAPTKEQIKSEIDEIKAVGDADEQAEQRRIERQDFMSRRGTFQITRELIADGWDGVMLVLQDVLIVRAEAMFWDDTIEYGGYSKHFAVVPENQIAPTYKPTIHTVDGKIDRIEWQRWEQ